MITRLLLISALFGVLPQTMAAQDDDDLYFVPKKQSKQESIADADYRQKEVPTYYCGSDRNVDEYNRRGKLKSYYQKIGADSLGNDIIEFHEGEEVWSADDTDSLMSVYPGSETYYDDDDYAYSRRMSRFDDFYGWYSPYYSYWAYPYWRSWYGWYDPWYTGWYGAGWYSPWYYDSFYGWGYPYYGWAGWHGPSVHYRYDGPTGTRNHAYGSGRFYGNRIDSNATTSRSAFSRNNAIDNNSRGSFGKRRSTYNSNNSSSQYQSPSRTVQTPTHSSFGSSRGSFGGGSGFGGGSRGGGSFGGGSRGGGFGGRR
jgi:uncharacterized membrane protein YgcG